MAFNVFKQCISRANNLVRGHTAAHGKAGKPEEYLSDLHRAVIVLAISALDACVRTYVLHRIRELLSDKKATLPPELSSRIRSFLKEDGLLEAARHDDLHDRVGKAFERDFEKKSFQGVDAITGGFQIVGVTDVFKQIAAGAGKNEDSLRADLEKFTRRRHQIAHRGDFDMSRTPQEEQPITKKNAKDCIALVEQIATQIRGF